MLRIYMIVMRILVIAFLAKIFAGQGFYVFVFEHSLLQKSLSCIRASKDGLNKPVLVLSAKRSEEVIAVRGPLLNKVRGFCYCTHASLR